MNRIPFAGSGRKPESRDESHAVAPIFPQSQHHSEIRNRLDVVLRRAGYMSFHFSRQ
jgi:hypothetical protein